MTTEQYKKECELAVVFYKYEIEGDIWKMHGELYEKWRVIASLRKLAKGTDSFHEYDRDYNKYYYMLDAYIDIVNYLSKKEPR